MNPNAPSLYELIAAKITAHPELLVMARENCARRVELGATTRQPLREWDKLLEAAQRDAAGFQRVLEILAARTPADERLRDFHPFAGILTREERRQARELCGYRH